MKMKDMDLNVDFTYKFCLLNRQVLSLQEINFSENSSIEENHGSPLYPWSCSDLSKTFEFSIIDKKYIRLMKVSIIQQTTYIVSNKNGMNSDQ